MRIRRSYQAQADVKAIWRYVATHNRDAADRLVNRIITATDRLSDHPESGTPKFDIFPGLRAVPVYPYIIYYHVIAGAVRNLHIRHGARKTPAGASDLR